MTEKSALSKDHKMKYMQEIKSKLFWKCMLSEFIATTLYSFIANTLCVTVESKASTYTNCRVKNSSGMLLAATGIGLAVATLSYVFRTNCGCYMNPAVAFGQFTCWKFSFIKTFFLLLMEMSGGIAGIALAYSVDKDHKRTYLGVSPEHITSSEGVVGQFIPSFLIVMVVLTCSDEKRGARNLTGSLMYGLVSVMAVLVAGQYSECTINPARILGLAIVLNRWKHPIWIYWVGSVAGGILAGVVYQLMFRTKHIEERKRAANHPFSINSSVQGLSRDKMSSPLTTVDFKEARSSKGDSAFWKKKAEEMPFIKDDTLAITKSTFL